MTAPAAPPLARRLALEFALWVTVGVVMGFLGPFGSSERTLFERLVYWQGCMVGGGAIGIAIDTVVRPRLADFWPRLLAVSVAMTPPVTLLVALMNVLLGGMAPTLPSIVAPWFQVFIVCFAAMALRQLVWAQPAPAPKVPSDPIAAFRRRLSARRREARIVAVEAEDHYLRVHTDAGDELITLKFADALAELSGARGFQTHRSWWVAADAIEAVRWLRGRGELTAAGGLDIPVSRTHAAALKDAGWF